MAALEAQKSILDVIKYEVAHVDDMWLIQIAYDLLISQVNMTGKSTLLLPLTVIVF